jgi:hypothetical protein
MLHDMVSSSAMDQVHTIRPPARTRDMVSSSAIEKGLSAITRQKLIVKQNKKRIEFSLSYLD